MSIHMPDGTPLPAPEPIDAMPREEPPDHNASAALPPLPSEDGKPKKRQRKNPLASLGQNKRPPRSRERPRDLTSDDLDKLRGIYQIAGGMMMPFNAGAAVTVVNASDNCVMAWDELARENDNVRRGILAVIEGGAWGKVFAAHVPIIMAFIPGNMRNMFGENIPADDATSENDTTP